MSRDIPQFIQHPWHSVNPEWDGTCVLGLIEIPRGERSKFEIHKQSGLMILDRVLSTSFEYPVNYGFIPQSLEDDGDPLDVLVLSKFPIPSNCLVKVNVLGILMMEDREKPDRKIIGVASQDLTLQHIRKFSDLPNSFFEELRHFFEQYTVLENKKVHITGFEHEASAYQVIEDCLKRYQEHFPGHRS